MRDTEPKVTQVRSIEERFWKKIKKTKSCWIWNGSGSGQMKYGEMTLGRRDEGKKRAHRISYEIHYGPIPKNLFVLHKCDNPSCVNPDHLFLGTFQDNMNDMLKKRRNSPPPIHYGSANSNSKLTIKKANEIREKLRYGTRIQTKLAKEYGVDRKTIFNIMHNKIWVKSQ